jgi:hypothetical protein
MSLTKNAKLRRASERGNMKRVEEIRKQIKVSRDNPVGEGCERCPEHSLAACFGDNCAKKCCGPNEVSYRSTQVVPLRKPSKNEMTRGGRKTRRKRRKKRRKSRKMRKKTKRRRKRRRKKSKKVRRK